MKKKSVCMMLAAVMALSFSVGVYAETDELSGKVTVSVVSGKGVQEGWEAVAAAYEELHPNVDVVVDLKAADGYGVWLTNVLSSPESTEVDVVTSNYAAERANELINMNDYLDMENPYADNQIWKETFNYDMQYNNNATGVLNNLCLMSTQVMWMYNADIFEEVGVEPPTTWDELIAVCEKIEAAGYQPIAADGDYHSFDTLNMAWLPQIYGDQTTRTKLSLVASQPGDYTYDPDLDAEWELDITDPWNDDSTDLTQNPLRYVKALLDGDIACNTEGMKTVWTNFAKVFPKYAGGDAFFGTNDDGKSALFYQGKAAMIIDAGWEIIEYRNNMKALEEGGSIVDSEGNAVENGVMFELGTFAMPTMEGEGIEAPVRTIEVANGFVGAIDKNVDQNALVIDFIKFYSSPQGMGKFIEAGLEAGYTPAGPSLVYGVKYPEDIEKAFENIKYIGNVQKNYLNDLARGPLVSAGIRQYYELAVQYLQGEITVDDYLNGLQEVVAGENGTIYEWMANKGITVEDLEDVTTAPTGN